MQETSAVLKINQENLVKTLMRNAFSNHHTVLGELMQNARRANASRVEFFYDADRQILMIRDDGQGVTSFQKLLEMAETGWDDSIVKEEKPFGTGFFSAIYAASHILVDSNGYHMWIDTESFLDFERTVICRTFHSRQGTLLTLFDIDIPNIKTKLKSLAKGFAMPVFLDGVEIERPHVLNVEADGPFVKTDAGWMHLQGLTVEKGRSVSNVAVYLQGLPVYHYIEYASRRMDEISNDDWDIIHLDSQKYEGRMPDRDKLRDEVDVVIEVKAIIKRLWQNKLRVCKETMSGKDFIDVYLSEMEKWDMVMLINDIPLLPKDYLYCWDEYPTTGIFDGVSAVASHIERDDVTKGKSHVFNYVSPDEYEGAMAAMYVYGMKGYMLRYGHKLDKEHWVFQYLHTIDDESINVKIYSNTGMHYYGGNYNGGMAVFCESYALESQAGCCFFTDEAIYLGEKGVTARSETPIHFIVPEQESTGMVVRQMSSFQNEYDEFMSDDADKEEEMFGDFIRVTRFDVAAELVQQELTPMQHKPFERIRGRSFFVSFDENKKPDVQDVSLNVAKQIEMLLSQGQVVVSPDISEIAVNLRRVFKRMHSNLKPGNSDHSNLIDLVNHADTLAQQIAG